MNHSDNPYRLEGKVALVTGAGRGIGASIVGGIATLMVALVLISLFARRARPLVALQAPMVAVQLLGCLDGASAQSGRIRARRGRV